MAKKVETKAVRDAKAKTAPKKVAKPRVKKVKNEDVGVLPPPVEKKKELSKTFKKQMAKYGVSDPNAYRKIRNDNKRKLRKGGSKLKK